MKKTLYVLLFLFIIPFSCVFMFSSCNYPQLPPSESIDNKIPEAVEAIGLKYAVNADKKTCTITGIGEKII